MFPPHQKLPATIVFCSNLLWGAESVSRILSLARNEFAVYMYINRHCPLFNWIAINQWHVLIIIVYSVHQSFSIHISS